MDLISQHRTPSRRSVLKAAGVTTAGIVAGWVAPRPLHAVLHHRPEPVPPFDDPQLKELAERAVDVAKSAGAAYADIRLTHTKERTLSTRTGVSDREKISAGIRVLVNGYWGFAASPLWGADELARMAQDAVGFAKNSARGKPRDVHLAPVAPVRNQRWVTPFKTDTFSIYPPDVLDYLHGVSVRTARLPFAHHQGPVFFETRVQDKAYASSLGSYFTQKTVMSEWTHPLATHKAGVITMTVPMRGGGFEILEDADVDGMATRIYETVSPFVKLPVKPVDVGKYDVVLDASTVAGVLQGSIGRATELDRALGYEANAGGTSYLNEPEEMLGVFKIGSPLLTVTANRSDPAGLATVGWDDEGVAPKDFTVVQNGILSNYHTNREGAGWLSDYYTKRQQPVASFGCAAAPEALDVPLIHPGNLVMQPGTEALGFQDLVKNLKSGIAFVGMNMGMDFQQTGGIGTHGLACEVKDGKFNAILPRAGVLFRSQELWKDLIALGGASSVESKRASNGKGEPAQRVEYTTSTVPVIVKNMTVIDYARKA